MIKDFINAHSEHENFTFQERAIPNKDYDITVQMCTTEDNKLSMYCIIVDGESSPLYCIPSNITFEDLCDDVEMRFKTNQSDTK